MNFTPIYSLHDLYNDLRSGHKKEFTYEGEIFTVKFEMNRVHVMRGNLVAIHPMVHSMTDLQGIAACLLYYKKDLVFSKQGDIINSHS